jgi:hypothetical protein
VFPLNIQPTPDGWEYALERPVNEKTIKLIYAIQDITLMVVFDISGTWSNGHNRIFRGLILMMIRSKYVLMVTFHV